LFLLLQTFAKWLGFLQKLQVFPNAGGFTEAKVNNVKKAQPKMCVQRNDSEVDMLIDTGSSINVIDEKTFKNLKCDVKLSKANIFQVFLTQIRPVYECETYTTM
jgi:hypothetical protein